MQGAGLRACGCADTRTPPVAPITAENAAVLDLDQPCEAPQSAVWCACRQCPHGSQELVQQSSDDKHASVSATCTSTGCCAPIEQQACRWLQQHARRCRQASCEMTMWQYVTDVPGVQPMSVTAMLEPVPTSPPPQRTCRRAQQWASGGSSGHQRWLPQLCGCGPPLQLPVSHHLALAAP